MMRLPRLSGSSLLLLLLLAFSLCWPLADGPRAAWLYRPTAGAPVSRPTQQRCGRFPCSFIRPLLRPEQAPPLWRPAVLSARRASLRPADLVVGLTVEGRSRAYPLGVLQYHRVINDQLGGQPVAVAHSPLSGATLCLRSQGLGGLRHSGSVLESDEVLVDGNGALWSVLLGERLRGASPAPRLSCAVMRWSAWRELRPRTDLVWPRRAAPGFDYRQDAWAWYRADPYHLVTPVHYLDLRVPHKQEVLGVRLAGRSFAYPLPPGRRRVWNLMLEGEPVLVLLDPERGFAAAYRRRQGDFTVELDQELRDRQGGRWNLLGEALSGPRAGSRLRPLPGGRALFIAWAALEQGQLAVEPALASGSTGAPRQDSTGSGRAPQRAVSATERKGG